MRRVIGIGAAALALVCAGAADARERMESITPRPGIGQDLYVADAQGTPWATAILYVGGKGTIGRPGRLTANFLMRIRDRLSAAGIGLIYPGPPSDHRDGYGDSRSSAEHVADAAAVVAWARAWSRAPIFIVGTSRGTVSAVNIAAHLPEAFAGVALMSSVTRTSRSGEAPINAGWAATIAVPVLVVHHRDDACRVTPPGDVPALVRSFIGSPRVDTAWITGGSEPRSEPCVALSRHGYIGVEDVAADRLIEWMRSVVATR